MEEFVVYVLYSKQYDKTYTGFTSDLIAWFKSHNQLGVKGYTLRYRPWYVIHVEFYESKSLALKREQYLKTGAGREFVRSLSKV